MRMTMRMKMTMTMRINKKKILIIYKNYQFNRQEILQKANEKYSKEKAAEYYLKDKEVIKEKARNVIETCQKKKGIKLKSIKKKSIKNWFNTKKKH